MNDSTEPPTDPPVNPARSRSAAASGDGGDSSKPDNTQGADGLDQQAGAGATQIAISGGEGSTILNTVTAAAPSDSTMRRWVKAGVIITALGVLIAALAYLGIQVWPGGGTTQSRSGRGLAPGASTKTPVATAKIVNTQPEGYLFAYPGPDSADRSKKANGTWKEGDTVTVVCQERHGRPISAPPYPGHPTTSTVWDRIEWPFEMWVPDIFTDLAKTADKPPAGLPTCDKWSG